MQIINAIRNSYQNYNQDGLSNTTIKVCMAIAVILFIAPAILDLYFLLNPSQITNTIKVFSVISLGIMALSMIALNLLVRKLK